MKTLAFLTGLLIAASAGAFTSRAPLVGQHVNHAFAGDALLICEYAAGRAKFEILSQTGKCAPYIIVQ